jgi:V/A-type H+-transporting ATPase subunit F
MKAYLISDNIDTQVGMRLAGIKGTIVHSHDEVVNELESILKDKEIGIIFFTEKAAAMARDEVSKLKIQKGLPLAVEVPDRHGTVRGRDSITRLIRESIGLKV